MRTAEREIALATLREMTKAEIIAWLSQEGLMMFRPPSRSQLLSARWRVAADAVQARRDKNTLDDGVAKELDRLRAELAKAKDHKEYLAIAKKATPYEKAWKKWLNECQAIQKEDAKVDALWDEYMKQSEKEQADRNRRAPAGGQAPETGGVDG